MVGVGGHSGRTLILSCPARLAAGSPVPISPNQELASAVAGCRWGNCTSQLAGVRAWCNWCMRPRQKAFAATAAPVLQA